MAWRRGEIWFDTDVSWFGEPELGSSGALALHAPSFLGLPPAAAPVENGLAASRQRRAELRKRRNARRTRTAALVMGPAVILTLAGQRTAGSRAGAPLVEDPPSQTVRAGGATPSETASPAPGGAGAAAKPPTAPGDGTVAEPSFPAIRWREATSHGLPYGGTLASGTQLPIEGVDWVTWNPVEDSVPNEPQRLHGHERTIRLLVKVLADHRAAHPDAPRVVVGDISFRGGGPMEQHRSHQNGLDVDVYYPRLDRKLRAPTRVDQVDRHLSQDLVDRFVAAGAQKIFVGFSTGLRGPGGVVVPYPNHENHLHVRFPRPPA